MRRRLAAMVALVAGAATIVGSVAIAVSEFPRGLGLLGCVAVAGSCAWYGGCVGRRPRTRANRPWARARPAASRSSSAEGT